MLRMGWMDAPLLYKKEYWQAQVSLWLIVEGRPESTVPLYNKKS